MPSSFTKQAIRDGVEYLRSCVEHWDDFPAQNFIVLKLNELGHVILSDRVESMDAEEFRDFLQFNVYGDSDYE